MQSSGIQKCVHFRNVEIRRFQKRWNELKTLAPGPLPGSIVRGRIVFDEGNHLQRPVTSCHRSPPSQVIDDFFCVSHADKALLGPEGSLPHQPTPWGVQTPNKSICPVRAPGQSLSIVVLQSAPVARKVLPGFQRLWGVHIQAMYPDQPALKLSCSTLCVCSCNYIFICGQIFPLFKVKISRISATCVHGQFWPLKQFV